MAVGAALLAVWLAAAGCTSSPAGQRTATTTGKSGTTSGSEPPTSSPPTAASTSTTVASCSNAGQVASWPLSRRAAELVVVPVLDAQPAAISVARQAGAGGILLLGSVPGAATLRDDLAGLATGGAGNMLVMTDEEGGEVQRLLPDVTSMPWPRTMAGTMTPAQVEALAHSVGAEMRALGVDMDLAPVLDLDGGPALSASDPDGPRSFSTDPAIASAYGQAFLSGLDESGVTGVVKHFPGLGESTGNTDYGPAATQPYASLEAAGLLPFEKAIGAGARAVMVANASVPGLTATPASLSPAVITGLLRDQLHFGGLVMTDSLSAGAISSAGYTVASAAVAAVEAGADMVLFGSTLTAADSADLAPSPLSQEVAAVVGALVGAVSAGALPTARLDQAVDDVLAAGGVDLCPA